MNKRKFDELEKTDEKEEDEKYFVSNMGRFKNPFGFITYGTKNAKGYLQVSVGKLKLRRVHQLVMRSHVGPPPTEKHTVDHIDMNITNNRLDNLRWATNSEQQLNRIHPKKINSRQIIVKNLSTLEEKLYNSTADAAKETGMSRGNINRYCNGTRNCNEGLSFRFADISSIEGEIWKKSCDVEVSNFGRIRRESGMVSFGTLTKCGHRSVVVAKKTVFVQSLVAAAFIGLKPSPLHFVCHVNGNKADNSASNLKWSTHSECMKQTHIKRRSSQPRPIEYRKIGEDFWNSCENSDFLSKKLGIKRKYITSVCCGHETQSYGYEFRYTEINDLEGEVWKQVVF